MRRSLGTLAAVASLASCGAGDGSSVDVLAASSFSDVADQLEVLIEQRLGFDVRFSFGSSGSFFEQLNQGAPAGVVITADGATMQRIEGAGLVDPSVAIADNRLVIVVADTEAGREITAPEDLARPGSVIVLCASSAPCGAASDELLAGIDVSPASREPNVRATLTKVLLGEADAALVYRTDALAHPEVRSIPIADDDNVAVTARAAAVPGDERAAEIVSLLVGPEARDILRAAGFGAP